MGKLRNQVPNTTAAAACNNNGCTENGRAYTSMRCNISLRVYIWVRLVFFQSNCYERWTIVILGQITRLGNRIAGHVIRVILPFQLLLGISMWKWKNIYDPTIAFSFTCLGLTLLFCFRRTRKGSWCICFTIKIFVFVFSKSNSFVPYMIKKKLVFFFNQSDI